MDTINILCNYCTGLLWAVSMDTLDQFIAGGRSVVQAGVVPGFVLGAFLSWLAMAFLR